MFVYQSTFGLLDLKIDKGTEYITGWKSKVLFEWKLLPLRGAFIPNVKRFDYNIGMQFDNTPVAIDENNYTTKIVNAYIVYDLNS